MHELSADVVVAGGGPAGSTAATLLARAGHRVVLLERAHHPRYQIGESLLPSTIHGVGKLLGIHDELLDAGFVRKPGGTFRWGRDLDAWSFKFSTMLLGGADFAYHVPRARFDQLLFDNAARHGVETYEGVDVLLPVWDGERVAGVRARDDEGNDIVVHADWVVDASGHGSRLARAAGKRIYSEFFQNVAVFGYFRGATREPEPNAGNILISAFENGWCWFIPISDEITSVGAVVDRSHWQRIRDDRVEALAWFIEQCPIVRDHLIAAHPVTTGPYGEVRVRKDWSYTTDRIAAPGLLLVGDAACFVDPVWASGVHLATYGGLLAARTLNTVLAGRLDEATCVEEFERRYRREYGVWFEYVLAFYDMEQDWESYFWTARKIVGLTERPSVAFQRLVAGGGTAPHEFFHSRAGSGESFRKLIGAAADRPSGAPGRLPQEVADSGPDAAKIFHERVREMMNMISSGPEPPMFEHGLVPTRDRLYWMRPPVIRPTAV